jgi:hypothetical protein
MAANKNFRKGRTPGVSGPKSDPGGHGELKPKGPETMGIMAENDAKHG